MPEQLSLARDIILNNAGAGIKTLVFKDKIQVVAADGALLKEVPLKAN